MAPGHLYTEEYQQEKRCKAWGDAVNADDEARRSGEAWDKSATPKEKTSICSLCLVSTAQDALSPTIPK